MLNSNNPLPNSGGSIINSNDSTTRATLITVNNSTQTFGGTIGGSTIPGGDLIDFYKYGNSNLFLTSAESYNGTTTVGGGTLYLRDSGVLTNSTSVTANYATFEIDNSGLTTSATTVPNRIPDVTNITLKGGTFFINGAGTLDTIQTVPTITTLDGQNTINLQPAINSGATVVLTINDLEHGGPESAVNFNGFVGQRVVSGNTSSANYGVNTLGQANLFTGSEIFINNLNGTPFTSANLVNNLIGGWAVANGGTFATYSDIYGVGGLGASASFPTFDGTDVTAATTTSAWNINDNSTHTLTGSKTINSLTMTANTGDTLTIGTGTTLSINVGILTNTNTNVAIAGTDATSKLTGTGTDLYVFTNQVTTTISLDVVDSGTGSMNLVKEGGATLTLTPSTGNTYGGTTYVQSGTLNLSGAANIISVPHDLVVNNGVVNEVTNAGQIASTSNVTLNGASSFVLPSWTVAQGATITTLASLTFNNPGGASNPFFNFNVPLALSTLVLTSNNAITSVNDNLGFTPTLTVASGGNLANTALEFTGTAPVINGFRPVTGWSGHQPRRSSPIRTPPVPLSRRAPADWCCRARTPSATAWI